MLNNPNNSVTSAVTVNTKNLLRELEWVARFAERKPTLPILTHVLLRKAGDFLHCTATDLEIGAHTVVEAAGPDFELCIPPVTLLRYLKKIAKDEREVLLVPLNDARLAVQHGEDRIVVDAMAVTSFPELPAMPPAMAQLGGLAKALPRACVSISDVESRFTLNGALLELEGVKARFIATDGHRLGVVEAKTFDTVAEPHKALIPRRALAEVARLGDSAYFAADDNHVFFAVGDRIVLSRRLVGNFPDYERVLPTGLKYSVTAQPAALRKVLDRVSLMADDRSRAMQVTVDGAYMHLRAGTTDKGESSGAVPINGPKFAIPYATGFNCDYVGDLLRLTDDQQTVQLSFRDARSAMLWDVAGWQYVLMPMRSDADADPIVEGEFEALAADHPVIVAQPAVVEPEPAVVEPEPAVVEPEPAVVAEPVRAEPVTYYVAASRLSHAAGYDRSQSGDIAASYSADKIADYKGKATTRKPFEHAGERWVAVGGGPGPQWGAYRIVPAAQFVDQTVTYATTDRNRPFGFYHGIKVNGGKFVLVGPEVKFLPEAAEKPAQAPCNDMQCMSVSLMEKTTMTNKTENTKNTKKPAKKVAAKKNTAAAKKVVAKNVARVKPTTKEAAASIGLAIPEPVVAPVAAAPVAVVAPKTSKRKPVVTASTASTASTVEAREVHKGAVVLRMVFAENGTDVAVVTYNSAKKKTVVAWKAKATATLKDAVDAKSLALINDFRTELESQDAVVQTVDAYVLARVLKLRRCTIYNRVKAGKLPQPETDGTKMTWPRSVLVQAGVLAA